MSQEYVSHKQQHERRTASRNEQAYRVVQELIRGVFHGLIGIGGSGVLQDIEAEQLQLVLTSPLGLLLGMMMMDEAVLEEARENLVIGPELLCRLRH